MLPLLVRVDNLTTGGSKQIAFDRQPVRVGRNPMNDLVLDEPFVSQWHGLVRFDERTTEYIDLGSTNGTLANGVRLEKNAPVQVAGDVELRISSLRFFCWRAENRDPTTSSRMAVPPLGPASSMILDGEKRVRMIGEVEASLALRELRPLYQQYRIAWSNLMAGVRRTLAQLPENVRDGAVLRLQKEMPALAGEEEFRALAEQHQLALPGAVAMSAGAAQLLGEFAGALVPGLKLSSLADVEKLLARAATTLETSARAFVELRKGYEEFGAEMAVGSVSETTPLYRSKDPVEVLRYLLDPEADVSERIQELTSAYADIMIHQIAVLNGVMEGVRGLLHRLSPGEIERALNEARPRWLPRSLVPFRMRARWKRFVERHREFSEEEQQLSGALFGPEFARAYAAVVGEASPETKAGFQT